MGDLKPGVSCGYRRHASVTRSVSSFLGISSLFKWIPDTRKRSCRKSVECQAGREQNRYSRYTVRSDGRDHLGSALAGKERRPFPGPPPGEGPPLRILPVGGLGEIGMNCMLVGAYDRYILVDAGLMFPDFTDLGMQKILPDASFLAQWRDRIEGVVITHGHEDHIGALPWVVPALDPNTPIYAGGFAAQLIKRRLQEFNLYNRKQLRIMKMRERFQLGPFEVEPVRVTHSIPDCCGLVLRSEHGTILHTGDWKIDEHPVDGEEFDREYFQALGKEGIALMMSDSTNVLSPGRTTSEKDVEANIIRRVMDHAGKGRVITTQFASNLHRLSSVKKAADASGRKICFIGMSLTTYLQAAHREGRAPFDPKDLVPQSAIDDMDPNELLIVTTGSQAEPRAALSLASRDASHLLKLRSSDLLLYSAKIIPGNDTRVVQMMNRIAEMGPEIAMGRDEGLHTSGHAYRGELEEALQSVKPQHFLPVHGEYAFLCSHAQLARDVGIRNTAVIRNGQMLGTWERRNGRTISTGSMANLGEVPLTNYYNDGNKGTGTAREMALEQRQHLAVEGVVIAAIDVIRDPRLIAMAVSRVAGRGTNQKAGTGNSLENMNKIPMDSAEDMARQTLSAKIRVTTKAMWTDQGRLERELYEVIDSSIKRLAADATLPAIERSAADAIKRACKLFNNRRPEVVVVVHESDPRYAAAVESISARRRKSRPGEDEESRRAPRATSVRARKQRVLEQREKDLLFAGRGGDVDELGTEATVSESSDEDNSRGNIEGSYTDEMISRDNKAKKTSQHKRMTGRSSVRSIPSRSDRVSSRMPPMQRLDPEQLKKRQQKNPRDSPNSGGNVEYP